MKASFVLTVGLIVGMLLAVVRLQDQTIRSQQHLIRKMETNKGCMTATGGNE